MSLIKKLEKRLELIIEGAFSRGFPSNVQPIEIAKKIDVELEENKTVGLSRTFAPNHYAVTLSSKDYEHLEGFIDAIKKELCDYVYSKASDNGLTVTDVKMEFKKDKNLKIGMFKLKSTLTKEVKEELSKEVEHQHTKIISKEDLVQSMKIVTHLIEDIKTKIFYKLIEPETVFGRSKTSDVSVNDPGISRKHFKLIKEGESIRLVDLESTNGTNINGSSIKAKMLRNGDKIEIGNTNFVYRRRDG